MNTLAEFAWTQIWQTTLVALGIGVLVRLTCHRRPHLAYPLWMIVILKCVTPPIWCSPAGAQDVEKEPNFVVIPIRTDLQRKLLNVDEAVLAVVELNGYGLVGKRDGELLRAIDEAALQKSLSALSRRKGKSSILIRSMYFGSATPEILQAAPQDVKPIEEACRAIASNLSLEISPSGQVYYNGVEEGWRRLVAASGTIDLAQETADESAEGDAQVMAFPVRTKCTRLLTSMFSSDDLFSHGPDCVVYLLKPLDADDDPLIDTVLRPRIEHAVSKLRLAEKNVIAFHLAPTEKDRESSQRTRDAIYTRVVGSDGEAERLAKALGFKQSSVSY